MADFGAPVAQNVNINPNQGLQTLSAIVGLKGQQAQVQQEQQTASQRKGIAGWVKSFDLAKHSGADGTLDMNSVLEDPNLRAAAGDQYPEVMQQLLGVKEHQLNVKQQLSTLNADVRTQFQQALGGLRTDPDITNGTPEGKNKVQEAISQFAASGPDAARMAQLYDQQIENTPPEHLTQMLSNIQLQAQSAGQQSASQAPNMQNVGGKLVNMNNQAPGAGDGGGPTLTSSAPVTVKPPPGYGSFQDQGGNTWFYNLQNPKEIMSASDAGKGQPAPTSAKPAGPAYMPVGATENVKQGAISDNDLFNNVTNAAKQAPQNKNILANLSKLADSGVFTGTGSQDVAALEGALGQVIPGFKGAGDAAADRQMMGKFTQQLAMSMTAQNYGTDQARDMVEHAIPNADNMTPQAIKRAAQYIQGQQQIAQARGAVANSYSQAHGGSTLGLRSIDTQFMQNIDPRMFDVISMNPEQQKKFMQDNFKSKQEWDDFRAKMQVISHLGGFNYGGQ